MIDSTTPRSDSVLPALAPPEPQKTLALSLGREARRFGLTALLASVLLILVVFAVAMTKASQTSALLGSLTLIVLTGLLGVGFSKLLQGLAAIAACLDDHSRQLESLRTAIEQASLRAESSFDPESMGSLKPQRLAEIRIAVRNANWSDAETLVRMFEETHPGEPETLKITQELLVAREKASQEILAKIKTAREVNDPDRVIELREALKPVLQGDPLRDLDRELGRWFMHLIQKRLRAGTVGVDVANLAGRVAGVLDETAEGASLRASLPTLRRAASLCPKCAQPYAGIADACPACVTQALAHQHAAKASRSSGTIPVYKPPKQTAALESSENG